MKTWRVELTAGGRSLTEEKIQRSIIQGDALSPLLFIIGMIPLKHILKKCTAGYIEVNNKWLTEWELPNQDKIRTLEENETYKYFGILGADTIKQVEMKKIKQNISGKLENYSRQNSIAETLSKE